MSASDRVDNSSRQPRSTSLCREHTRLMKVRHHVAAAVVNPNQTGCHVAAPAVIAASIATRPATTTMSRPRGDTAPAEPSVRRPVSRLVTMGASSFAVTRWGESGDTRLQRVSPPHSVARRISLRPCTCCAPRDCGDDGRRGWLPRTTPELLGEMHSSASRDRETSAPAGGWRVRSEHGESVAHRRTPARLGASSRLVAKLAASSTAVGTESE